MMRSLPAIGRKKVYVSDSHGLEKGEENEAPEAGSEEGESSEESKGMVRGEEAEEPTSEDLEPWHQWKQRVTRVSVKEMQKPA